jgi:hypothetical protein
MNRRAVLLFVFALLTLSPVLGLTAGLARANSDIPTPSGSYTLTGFGDTQTISLNCTSTFCDFSGYGTSLRLSRTEDFSEITSRWIRDNKVMLAGGEIVTSGRFHSANVPEYPAISQYWIPSSIGNFRTSDFETIYRSNVEGGGGTLQGPNGPQTSPKGYLLVHWIAPRLFFNLTWNAINPTANCFANVSGCANTQIGMVAIGETTTTTTITATTIAPATTEVATTTIAPPATEVATTTIAPPATEVATTTVPVTETTLANTASTLPEVSTTVTESGESSDPEDEIADESPSGFVSPYRPKPISTADATTTLVATVAGLSTLVAAGAALSSATMLSPPTIGGIAVPGPGPVQGPGSPTPQTRTETISESPSTTEVASGMFTTEHLDRAETLKVADIAKPRLIKISRISSRIFYDTGLVNALCMLLPIGFAVRATPERPEPRLTRASFLLSLLIPVVASMWTLLMPSFTETSGVAILIILLFMMGWLSALHGLVFALVSISLDLSANGNELDPLKIALIVVASSFAPLLACTLIDPEWYRKLSMRIYGELIIAFAVMFLISLKLSQEIQQQLTATPPGLLSWPILLPAVFGAMTPLLRFMSELRLRQHDTRGNRLKAATFLEDTAQLRRGEILDDRQAPYRIFGLSICVLILGFIVHAYTSDLRAVALICLAFILIAILHFPLQGESGSGLLHEIIPINLTNFRGLPDSTKLALPTVAAMSIGLIVNWRSPSVEAALWISVGFAYLVFLFELYDVKTTHVAMPEPEPVHNSR